MRDLKDFWRGWPHRTAEEARAEDMVRTLAAKDGEREIPIPIPVEEWGERHLKVNFEVLDHRQLPPGVIGVASCGEPPSIFLSDRIEYDNGRSRFTYAHELGHIVEHRDVAVRFEDADRTMLQQDQGLEAQANRFASRFLMPWEALQSEVPRILHECDVDLQAYVEILLSVNERSVWLWKYRVLPRITELFEVSLSAAIYRFSSIRLPGGGRFLPRETISRLLTSDTSTTQTLAGALGGLVPRLLIPGRPLRHTFLPSG